MVDFYLLQIERNRRREEEGEDLLTLNKFESFIKIVGTTRHIDFVFFAEASPISFGEI